MSSPGWKDRERQAADAQARERRAQREATLDARLKRLHEAGSTDAEIAREMGTTHEAAKNRRERLGLPRNKDALFKTALD